MSASADHSVRMWSESMADPIFAEVEREELHEKEIVDEIEKDLQEDDGSNVQQACLPTNTSLGYAETILMVLNSEKFNEDPALQNELKIKIQNMPPNDYENILTFIDVESAEKIIIILIEFLPVCSDKEYVSRIILFLFRFNFWSLKAKSSFGSLVKQIQQIFPSTLLNLKEKMCFNLAALEDLKRCIAEKENSTENNRTSRKKARYIFL